MHRRMNDKPTTQDGVVPAPARGPVWGPPAPQHTLVLDGDDVLGCWLAETRAERNRGLLGTDSLEGALWIRRCSNVHTFRMQYAIDVVLVRRDGRVHAVETLAPGRFSRPRPYGLDAVELPAGLARTLGIVPGRVLTCRRLPDADPCGR